MIAKSPLILLIALVISSASAHAERSAEYQLPPSDILIVPASDFLNELPKGNIIVDANAAKADWLFNNTGISLRSESNMMVNITVPSDGLYHLFVRSIGNERSSFKVAINDRQSTRSFGSESISWQQGGSFELKKGKANFKITRIDPGSIFDVAVLTKNASLTENDIRPYQLHPDVMLHKEYVVPPSNNVKFGDINGDGATDFMVLTPDFSSYIFDNSGKELWSWKAPEAYTKERSEFEAPGLLWDFNRDGKAEVVHWRTIDEKEWLVVASGENGDIISKVEWPTKPLPHVYNNFRLAIGKLTKAAPNEIVVFTDMGGTININAYSSDLRLLWSHTEERRKDHLGHYVYPVDLDGDGIDEVLVGSLLLDARGKKIWSRLEILNDNHDHADSYKFGDVNGDGKTDIVTANSETGVFVYEAMTGEIIWQNTAEHTQQIQVGNFLKGMDNPQVVAGARTYGNRQAGEPYLSGQLFWFSRTGEKLFRWPDTPINGNPDFVKGDWRGDGVDQLFWFKFRIGDNGKGTFYFPDPVYHMFDFMGTGAEQVITLTRGRLSIYGSKSATQKKADRKKDLNYLKGTVVNHTHY